MGKTIRDKGHGMVIRSLHGIGALTRSNPTQRFQDDPGAADVFCLYKGFGCAIEIKTGNEGIAFASWRENQREWAYKWSIAQGIPYWIWWCVRNPKRGKSQGFLVPYQVQIFMESQVETIQRTLPQYIGKGYDLALQENGWDCQHFLKDFETPIMRDDKGQYVFTLPKIHDFITTQTP